MFNLIGVGERLYSLPSKGVFRRAALECGSPLPLFPRRNVSSNILRFIVRLVSLRACIGILNLLLTRSDVPRGSKLAAAGLRFSRSRWFKGGLWCGREIKAARET